MRRASGNGLAEALVALLSALSGQRKDDYPRKEAVFRSGVELQQAPEEGGRLKHGG